MRSAAAATGSEGGARRRLPALACDRRGAAAIEFGLCAAMFVALLLACIETALVFFAQASIQTAAETSARQVLTGQAQSASMTAAQFKTQACTALPAYMDCAKLMIDVRTASSFSAVSTTPTQLTYAADGTVNNSFSYSLGVAGNIVIVRLMYPWSTPTGPLGFTLANQGTGSSKRLLIGTMVFKTEPFQS